MSRIVDFFKNLINTIMDGSLERVRIVSMMNQGFRECYYSGELSRLCHVSIAAGNPDYRHEMSSIWLRSGFKITIENDNGLTESDTFEIAQYILTNVPFVRQLMSMGFDTLTVIGKNSTIGKQFSLKGFADLLGYFLEQ